MSVFCPKCGKQTYNEYTCDHCQTAIKENNLPKQRKKIKIQNPLLTISLMIMTIAISYIAYNKYEEKQLEKKALKYITGTENPEELFELNSKERIDKLMKKSGYAKDLKHMSNQLVKIGEDALNSYKLIELPIYIDKKQPAIQKTKRKEKKEKPKINIIIKDKQIY